jgi:hypothetical protein
VVVDGSEGSKVAIEANDICRECIDHQYKKNEYTGFFVSQLDADNYLYHEVVKRSPWHRKLKWERSWLACRLRAVRWYCSDVSTFYQRSPMVTFIIDSMLSALVIGVIVTIYMRWLQ